jgi:predicted DNA-binding protein (UPF0251 family)
MPGYKHIKTPMEFNVQQYKAIELLAVGDLSYQDVAKAVGVARSTLVLWKKQRPFMDAVIARARELIREALPELYQSAINEAKKGKHAYFKTLLEHIDRLEQMSNQTEERHIVFQWKRSTDAEDID